MQKKRTHEGMFDLTFHFSHIARLAKQSKDEEASPLDVKLCGDARRVTGFQTEEHIISALQEPEPL